MKTIVLTRDQLIKAVQVYFDLMLFREGCSPVVTDISRPYNYGDYELTVQPREEA